MIPDRMIIGRGNDGRIRHSYWTTDQELTAFEDTVFIRKDALLEWAKEKIAKGTIDEWDKGYVQCLKDLIEKLESFC